MCYVKKNTRKLTCLLDYIVQLLFMKILDMFWSYKMFFNPFKASRHINLKKITNCIIPITPHYAILDTKNNDKDINRCKYTNYKISITKYRSFEKKTN